MKKLFLLLVVFFSPLLQAMDPKDSKIGAEVLPLVSGSESQFNVTIPDALFNRLEKIGATYNEAKIAMLFNNVYMAKSDRASVKNKSQLLVNFFLKVHSICLLRFVSFCKNKIKISLDRLFSDEDYSKSVQMAVGPMAHEVLRELLDLTKEQRARLLTLLQMIDKEKNENFYLLIDAILCNDINQMNQLLKDGVNVLQFDVFGNAPIYYTIAYDCWEATKLLVDHAPNAPSKLRMVNFRNDGGLVPVLLARANGPIYKLLNESGADVNAEDDIGFRPLQTAIAFAGQNDGIIVKNLIDCKAKVIQSDYELAKTCYEGLKHDDIKQKKIYEEIMQLLREKIKQRAEIEKKVAALKQTQSFVEKKVRIESSSVAGTLPEETLGGSPGSDFPTWNVHEIKEIETLARAYININQIVFDLGDKKKSDPCLERIFKCAILIRLKFCFQLKHFLKKKNLVIEESELSHLKKFKQILPNTVKAAEQILTTPDNEKIPHESLKPQKFLNLLAAILAQDVELVKSLLKDGVDPNDTDDMKHFTPLCYAIISPFINPDRADEIISILIKFGARVDAPTPFGIIPCLLLHPSMNLKNAHLIDIPMTPEIFNAILGSELLWVDFVQDIIDCDKIEITGNVIQEFDKIYKRVSKKLRKSRDENTQTMLTNLSRIKPLLIAAQARHEATKRALRATIAQQEQEKRVLLEKIALQQKRDKYRERRIVQQKESAEKALQAKLARERLDQEKERLEQENQAKNSKTDGEFVAAMSSAVTVPAHMSAMQMAAASSSSSPKEIVQTAPELTVDQERALDRQRRNQSYDDEIRRTNSERGHAIPTLFAGYVPLKVQRKQPVRQKDPRATDSRARNDQQTNAANVPKEPTSVKSADVALKKTISIVVAFAGNLKKADAATQPAAEVKKAQEIAQAQQNQKLHEERVRQEISRIDAMFKAHAGVYPDFRDPGCPFALDNKPLEWWQFHKPYALQNKCSVCNTRRFVTCDSKRAQKIQEALGREYFIANNEFIKNMWVQK